MSMMPLWSEWKRWTEPDNQVDLKLIQDSLQELMGSKPVWEFVSYLADYLTFCRVQEVSRHVDDPNRKQRTYQEALREISQRLDELRNLNDRKRVSKRPS